MGFRSDVYIKVNKKHKYNLLDKLHSVDLTPDHIAEDDDYFVVELHQYTWAYGYRDTNTIDAYVNSLDEEGGLLQLHEDGSVDRVGDCYEVGLDTYTLVEGADLDGVPNAKELLDFPKFKEQNPEVFL